MVAVVHTKQTNKQISFILFEGSMVHFYYSYLNSGGNESGNIGQKFLMVPTYTADETMRKDINFS